MGHVTFQDRSSYAIQEVLKIYKCSDTESKAGQSLWNRFPPEVQEIFTPMLSSRYALVYTVIATYLGVPCCFAAIQGPVIDGVGFSMLFHLVQLLGRKNSATYFSCVDLLLCITCTPNFVSVTEALY